VLLFNLKKVPYMALIKFSAVVGDASGKLGGIVFSKNGNGAYIKEYSSPVNPNTAKQAAVRETFGFLAAHYRTLSKADQSQWESMTKQYPYQNRMGDTKFYSGQQLFMKLNQFLLANLGGDPLANCPVPVDLSACRLDNGSITATEGGVALMELEFTEIGAATEAIVLYATAPMSSGINRVPDNAYRKIMVIHDASLTNTYEILGAYSAVFGVPPVGAQIGIKSVLFDKGMAANGSNGQILLSS